MCASAASAEVGLVAARCDIPCLSAIATDVQARAKLVAVKREHEKSVVRADGHIADLRFRLKLALDQVTPLSFEVRTALPDNPLAKKNKVLSLSNQSFGA